MKKLTILTLLMLSLGVVLTGCSSKSDVSDTDSDTVVSDVQVDDGDVKDRNEYQFTMIGKSSDGVETEMRFYKKGGDSLADIVKMGIPEGENMPFTMKKLLSVGDKTYQLIEKDGKEYWFVVPGINSTDDMFNLKKMSTIDKNMVSDTKKEKINGKKMTCFYVSDAENGEGKACLFDGVYRYGEYTQDGVKQTIIIDDYDDDVKSSVFKTPSDDEILSTQDMMKLMQ